MPFITKVARLYYSVWYHLHIRNFVNTGLHFEFDDLLNKLVKQPFLKRNTTILKTLTVLFNIVKLNKYYSGILLQQSLKQSHR